MPATSRMSCSATTTVLPASTGGQRTIQQIHVGGMQAGGGLVEHVERVTAGPADRPDAFVGCLQGHPGRRRGCEFITATSAKAAKPVAPLSFPELPADLDAGLRRLKLAAIRRTVPEVLQTAKTQRWTCEEVLRTLVEPEWPPRCRPTSSTSSRLPGSLSPRPWSPSTWPPLNTTEVFAYPQSLEWVRTQQDLTIIRPAGTGKSHTLMGLGIAAIDAGHKIRYFTAADLIETVYRGLADNIVGKIIESLLQRRPAQHEHQTRKHLSHANTSDSCNSTPARVG